MDYFKHPSADVSPEARIGSGTKVWHNTHIREGVVIGIECVIGQNVYIDTDVQIGDYCRIQNNCSVYHTTKIGNFVFLGPNVILTNDKHPRAFNKQSKPATPEDWTNGTILVEDYASIGAGSIILPDIVVGQYAMVGAGSVVTKDIEPYVLVYGNPATVRGKVDKLGHRLP